MVLMLGAGDITDVAARMARRLSASSVGGAAAARA